MGSSIYQGEAMNKEVPMLRYQVADMSCGHCVQAITQAVKSVDAGAQVKVDLTANSVDVETTAEDATVREAIREAGYTPEDAGQAAAPARAGCCGGCG
jgi:copper chaperone